MKLLKDATDRLVLVNCVLKNKELTAGYFFCDRGLPAGNYQLVDSQSNRIITVQLPEQAVGLPGVGQQFNYPFQIIED